MASRDIGLAKKRGDALTQKILIAVLVSYSGYITYLDERGNAHQKREILELQRQLDIARTTVPQNGTLAQQATCAGQAEAERRQNAQNSGGGGKILMATAVGHYNAALNRCLIRSQITEEMSNDETIWLDSVKDAFDGTEFGMRITMRDHLRDSPKTNRIASCSFKTPEGDHNCTSAPDGFDEHVNGLMGGSARW